VVDGVPDSGRERWQHVMGLDSGREQRCGGSGGGGLDDGTEAAGRTQRPRGLRRGRRPRGS
jgi:hypothetical protein